MQSHTQGPPLRAPQTQDPLPQGSPATGFGDPVLDSQSVFRRAMEAMASPGRIRQIGDVSRDAASALALTLLDFETPVHVSPTLAAIPRFLSELRFHTGAPLADDPGQAAFAMVDLRADRLDLTAFACGTPEYPDRSTTIIALCDSVADGPALSISGPGIKGVAWFCAAPLPADFLRQWAANRALFPLGVDMIFAAGDSIVALPRSARLALEQPVLTQPVLETS